MLHVLVLHLLVLHLLVLQLLQLLLLQVLQLLLLQLLQQGGRRGGLACGGEGATEYRYVNATGTAISPEQARAGRGFLVMTASVTSLPESLRHAEKRVYGLSLAEPYSREGSADEERDTLGPVAGLARLEPPP